MISVIIPVYNAESYLERCISSVITQSYKDTEIILIDDGSTDSSGEICDKWASKDNRVKTVHRENRGVAFSRNEGIKLSKGEYIAFVDSDDFIYKDMLLIMLERMETDSSDMAICNRLGVSSEDVRSERSKEYYPVENAVITKNEMFARLASKDFSYYVNTWGKLYKRELFDSIEFPVGRLHEDVFVMHLIFDLCEKISCVRYAMYYRYENDESITNTYSLKRLDVIDAYLERFEFFMEKKMKPNAAYTFEGIIWNYNDIVNHLEDNEESAAALKEYKKKCKKAYRRLLLSGEKSAYNKRYFRFFYG